MISKEAAMKKFVEGYNIEVPQAAVDEEFRFCMMNMKHQMRYAEMSGEISLNPMEQRQAMTDMEEELKEAAHYNVKEEMVIRDVIRKHGFQATQKELEQYAEELVKRQNSDTELVRRFFGEDLALLEGDVKRQKAEAWIYEQM